MSDLLDEFLASSDEESNRVVEVPQPKAIVKRRLCSPTKKSSICTNQSKLGMIEKKNESNEIIIEPFFGIRVKSGVVDNDALNMLCKDMQKVGILSTNSSIESSWMTIGIIVDKSLTLKSSNGNEYLVWKLHDLKRCEDKPRKVLLFGECVKQHWKLQKGSVVALLSPQVLQDDRTKESTLKVSKSRNVVHLGTSVDLSTCKAKKSDGTSCHAFVNQSKCEMCVYHAASEVRKLAARRGTFSQSVVVPNKDNIIRRNGIQFNQRPKSIVEPIEKSKSKEEIMKSEKEVLSSLISERNLSLGARCLTSISQDKTTLAKKHSDLTNFREFLSQTSSSQKKNERSIKEEDAVKRALRILEANKDGKKEKKVMKRLRNEDDGDKMNKECMNNRDRVRELLAKRSKHENEAEEMENELVMNHLDGLDRRDTMENITTSCKELKDIRVFSCSICKYTSKSRSDYCIKQGHSAKSHLANKRFFKCKSCSHRISTYALLPTKPCQGCRLNDWERVGMMDERKVKLDNENLQIRGEERTFINS